MINVVIVEDCKADSTVLNEHIARYGKSSGEVFSVREYESALKFLDEYKADADIIFMDIELPDIDGMEACRRLRQIDDDVVIFFVTNMTQYAIKGYGVNALDYVLKPVQYFGFEPKMKKAVKLVKQKYGKFIMLGSYGTQRRININDIFYIEIRSHSLLWHTDTATIETIGSLKEQERNLSDQGFYRCNSCYLVNLKYVTEIRGNIAVVGGDELTISRPKKREFLKRLATWLSVAGGQTK